MVLTTIREDGHISEYSIDSIDTLGDIITFSMCGERFYINPKVVIVRVDGKEIYNRGGIATQIRSE